MNTIDFIKKVLPSEGHIYLVVNMPFVMDGRTGKGMRHIAFTDPAKFEYVMKARDAEPDNTVYFACSTYKEAKREDLKKKYRSDENWYGARSFWMDIDCGEGKPYANHKEGFLKLKEVCKAHSLPYPMVVISGNGVHAYWVTDTTLTDMHEWMRVASMLHEVMLVAGLKFDTTKTRDPKAVLRPIGSTHRKDPTNPKAVRLAVDQPVLALEDFIERLTTVSEEFGLSSGLFDAMPSYLRGTDEDSIGKGNYIDIPSDAELIAQKCKQVGDFKACGGDVGYEIWRPMLGVLGYTANKEVMYDWSSGHPGYSRTATTEEFEKWHEGASGNPARCSRFEGINPDGCEGCEFKGKISTPLQLGRTAESVQEEEKVVEVVTAEGEVVEDTVPGLPTSYYTTPNGGMGAVVMDAEGNTSQRVFLSCKLYVTARVKDYKNEYHLMCKRVSPMGEVDEFEIPSYMLNSQTDLLKTLGVRDVILDSRDPKASTYLTAYLRDAAEELRRKALASRTVRNFGWDENLTQFVIGRDVFKKDGTVERLPMTKHMEDIMPMFADPQGTLQGYINAVDSLYNHRGVEVLQYAFLSGYGSILNVFGENQYNGVSFVLYSGDSGLGKTTVCKAAMAGFGNPEKRTIASLRKGGTTNAIMKTIATAHNMPVLMDEVSANEDVELFRTMAYTIADGKDKLRLRQDSTMMAPETWRMTPYVTSNKDLQALLDPGTGEVVEAQKVRVVQVNLKEFKVKYPTLSKTEITDILAMAVSNSGHAGRLFASYVVQNQKAVRDRINVLKDEVFKVHKHPALRFWIDHYACTVAAGEILKELGIVQFDMGRLEMVGRDVIQHNVDKVKLNSQRTAEDVLEEFLDANIPRIAKTESLHTSKGLGHENTPIRAASLVGRWVVSAEVEGHDGEAVNMLYLRQSELRRWCTEKGHSFDNLVTGLEKLGIYKGTKKMRLSTGLNIGSINAASLILDMRTSDTGHAAQDKPAPMLVEAKASR